MKREFLAYKRRWVILNLQGIHPTLVQLYIFFTYLFFRSFINLIRPLAKVMSWSEVQDYR